MSPSYMFVPFRLYSSLQTLLHSIIFIFYPLINFSHFSIVTSFSLLGNIFYQFLLILHATPPVVFDSTVAQ